MGLFLINLFTASVYNFSHSGNSSTTYKVSVIHSGEAYNLLVFSYALIGDLIIVGNYTVFARDKGGELALNIDHRPIMVSS